MFLKNKSKGFFDFSIYKIDRFVLISFYFLMTSNFFIFFGSKELMNQHLLE